MNSVKKVMYLLSFLLLFSCIAPADNVFVNQICREQVVYAAPVDVVDDVETPEKLTGMKGLVYSMIHTVLVGNIGTTVKDIFTGKVSDIIMDNMKPIYNGLKNIGMALVTLYFLRELVEQATRENFGMNQFYKLLLKLLIAKFLLDNGWTVLTALVDLGNQAASIVNSSAGDIDGSELLSEWETTLEGTGQIACIAYMVKWLTPYILSYLCRLIVFASCFSRYLLIGVYAAAAPIGMADIFSGGSSSQGFRYLKRFFSVCLQAFVIMTILVALGACQGAILGTVWYKISIVRVIGFNLAAVALITQSRNIADQIVGV